MRSCLSEPALGELLSDPMVQALMAADRVRPDQLKADLSRIAGALQQPRAKPCPRPLGTLRGRFSDPAPSGCGRGV
jgi:hypothetical protein